MKSVTTYAIFGLIPLVLVLAIAVPLANDVAHVFAAVSDVLSHSPALAR
ncbi:hypothetical protein ACLKMY_00660 [Paraburkholderia mimosarum]